MLKEVVGEEEKETLSFELDSTKLGASNFVSGYSWEEEEDLEEMKVERSKRKVDVRREKISGRNHFFFLLLVVVSMCT